MSNPRRLPPAVEPDLPQDPNAFLGPNEEPVPPEVLNGPLPGEDNRFYGDMYNDSGAAPQEVVDDVLPEVRRAEPAPREATASMMDTSFINKINDPNLTDEQARAEYDRLPPALRYVYDRVADFSYNNPDTQTPAQLDPRDANRWLDEFYQMQQKGKEADPAKQREQAQQAARVQSVLGIVDKYTAEDSDLDQLVGPAAGSFVANEYDKWQNPDRYAKRFELSFTTKTEVLEAAKYVKPLSNDERKFLEEMFPRRDDPPQVWREYFKRTREILAQGLPQQSRAQGAAPAAAAPQSSQPPANLKPTRIDPVTGQPMTLIQNQQGKWVYRLAPQQPQQSNASGR
jgi:hypothetical protein